MKTNNLIPVEDYNILIDDKTETSIEYRLQTLDYAFFVKQKLTLGMFIPCDEEGNKIEQPTTYGERGSFVRGKEHERKIKQFKKAQEKVLFKGFQIKEVSNVLISILNKKIIIYFDIQDDTIMVKGKSYYKTISDLTQFNLELVKPI